MNAITASELDAQGVSILEHRDEAEIASAWREARAAVDRGDFVAETAEEHIARLQRNWPKMS